MNKATEKIKSELAVQFPAFQLIIYKRADIRKNFIVLSRHLFNDASPCYVFYEYDTQRETFKRAGFLPSRKLPAQTHDGKVIVPQERLVAQPPEEKKIQSGVHSSWKWSYKPLERDVTLETEVRPALQARLELYEILKKNNKLPPMAPLLQLDSAEAVLQDRLSFEFSVFALTNELFQQELPSKINNHAGLWIQFETKILQARLNTVLREHAAAILQSMLGDIYPGQRYSELSINERQETEFHYEEGSRTWKPVKRSAIDSGILDCLRETDEKASKWIKMPFEMVTSTWLYRNKKLLLLAGYAYVPSFCIRFLPSSLARTWLIRLLQTLPVVTVPQKPFVQPALEQKRATSNYAQQWARFRKDRRTPPCDTRLVELQNGWHKALEQLADVIPEEGKLQQYPDLFKSVPLPPCIRSMMDSCKKEKKDVYPAYLTRQYLTTFFVSMQVNPMPLISSWKAKMDARQIADATRQVTQLMKKRRLTYGCFAVMKAGMCVYKAVPAHQAVQSCSKGLELPQGQVIKSPMERSRLVLEKRARGVIQMDTV